MNQMLWIAYDIGALEVRLEEIISMRIFKLYSLLERNFSENKSAVNVPPITGSEQVNLLEVFIAILVKKGCVIYTTFGLTFTAYNTELL